MLHQITSEYVLAADREACFRSLAFFIKRAWRVIEPEAPYVHGWHIDAICEHLEAVTAGQIRRLYIAVPPGTMKSLTVGCFWPAWEWGPRKLASYRYLGTSHSASLAIRDNVRMRRLIQSQWYQERWGDIVKLSGDQNAKTKFENDKTGFREAMAFTGLTGNRGDRILMDDVMSVDDALSDVTRNNIVTTFLESVPSRLNKPSKSAIINIQQRLHERDTIGVSEANELGYEGLVLPMEFEPERRCVTSIGFRDPRTEEGELLFPERFPRESVDDLKRTLGEVAAASQLQQRPIPRGGLMFKRDWFEIVSSAPANTTWVRGWDLAATDAKKKEKQTGSNDPAYTAGAKVGIDAEGTIYIADVTRDQLSPGKVERLLKNVAKRDGRGVTIDLPQDPGQAGKAQIRTLVKLLAGYTVVYGLESGSKELRAMPLAAQAEIRNVKLVAGPWVEAFLSEAEKFPRGRHKDQIDAASRALARLTLPSVDDSFSAPMVLENER